MIKLDPSITDPKVLARRIAELHDRVEQLEAEIERLKIEGQMIDEGDDW
jgi:cell division protein FtsB